MLRFLFSIGVFIGFGAAVVAEPAIELNLPANGKATIDITGLDGKTLAALEGRKLDPEQWNNLFSVNLMEPNSQRSDLPLLRGKHRIENGVIRFEPRFPLVVGMRYHVSFGLAAAGYPGSRDSLQAVLSLPRPDQPPAAVERVYPSADVLPENLLRFYIHFNVPMAQGQAYGHVKLLDGEGKVIDSPFLELFEELWDRDGKRFTLLIDPGRIKKGLKPREDLGPVLEQGKTYTLVVEAAWPDTRGNPMKQELRKTFRAAAPVEVGLDPASWKVQSPPSGMASPVKVTIPAPLDNALMRRLIWVADAKGQTLAGKVAVSGAETVWEFTPEKPWEAGGFNVVVETSLEDVSGNRVGHPFEVDVLKPIPREVVAQTVKLPFTVKPAK